MSTQTSKCYVQKKVWDLGDEYFILEVQVDSSKFKRGERVKVTVESITD